MNIKEEEKKEYRREFARLGGQAIVKQRGSEYMSELGKKSAQKRWGDKKKNERKES